MSQSILNEEISNYYKLKENYESKINQSKQKILNNPTLTIEEKRIKFKQLKKTCIGCKEEGGTLFTSKNGILKATCNHTGKPCNLHIEIDKGKYELSTKIIDDLQSKINIFKTDIIKIKLDYLFGYISESDALAKFNTLKEELSKNDELYKKVELFYINVADNPETDQLIKNAERDLFIAINKIKDYCKVYKTTENKYLLKTVAESYISDIIPLNKTINDLKYIVRTVEKTDDINFLIEKKTTLESLEYTLEEGKILSNKK